MSQDEEVGSKDPEPNPGAEDGSSPAETERSHGDRFQPDAIAARIDQLGEETEIDRIARQEEQKLAERKKEKKGKRGLEAAASKRLARIGEGTVKRPPPASNAYIPEADPLLERVRHARKWIAQHQRIFGVLIVVAVFGVGGGLGYAYWQGKHEAEGSALLGQAFAAEHGHVSEKEDDEDDARTRQLYPTFKSASDRRAAAAAKYKTVESKFAGTGAAILARLGEAGLLLDRGDTRGAISAYEDVKGSALAQADAEVRGRALEGLGFAHELAAQNDPAEKDSQLADAVAAFKLLEQVDVIGFRELGMYHQARVLETKGEKNNAIEVLKDAYRRVSEPGDSRPFSYLEFVVEDRLRELDPAFLPPRASKKPGAGGPGGAQDMSDPQVQQLIRQLQQQAQQRGGGR